ncbi:hypothetical protein [Endozoicomonas acroporae]|uniref:hypothetical protein n=1 Tax=Endozoicomonas acroporae TaxID=1701104 RepID=UPI0013D2A2D6|nr:hypothetical protein [Endozoicomonas acroporae]
MATFVDVPGANGEIKIKAVCRVWKDGKQKARCKTFPSREAAELWADDVEQSMKEKVAEERLTEIQQPANPIHSQAALETINDMQEIAVRAHGCISSMLGQESFLLLGVNNLVCYFEQRIKEGATENEIRLEVDLLCVMFQYRDQYTGSKDFFKLKLALSTIRGKISRVNGAESTLGRCFDVRF